ncbi:vacuolar protein sorting/targeting protein PEP1 [Modicella reniformis]|uniref:Vacuolar protein sorting/targeting protein PEP1 n=1 Tax=Modicella reniformis TaxID=1440133 RepID=A0A9P6MGW9_9FUNG|nr:vacuolar protein sorting/targeting protein PEP1 [Modicella reniformis]
MHDENEKQAYLLTNKDIYVSRNGGDTFDQFDFPARPNQFGFPLIDFHPDKDECFTRLYSSQNAERSWAEVDYWVDKAVYASRRKLDMPDNGVFAMTWKKPMPKNFYAVDAFLAVPVVSIGVRCEMRLATILFYMHHGMAQAVFPPNIRVDKNGFTVLQSTTGALMVDVAKPNVPGREHGRLFKSNSNGTFFSLQLDNTNRNEQQLVDWEKIGGIEGVVLANQVINTETLARMAQSSFAL